MKNLLKTILTFYLLFLASQIYFSCKPSETAEPIQSKIQNDFQRIHGYVELVEPSNDNDDRFNVYNNSGKKLNIGFNLNESKLLGWFVSLDYDFKAIDENLNINHFYPQHEDCEDFVYVPYEVHDANERVQFLMFEIDDDFFDCVRFNPPDSSHYITFHLYAREK